MNKFILILTNNEISKISAAEVHKTMMHIVGNTLRVPYKIDMDIKLKEALAIFTDAKKILMTVDTAYIGDTYDYDFNINPEIENMESFLKKEITYKTQLKKLYNTILTITENSLPVITTKVESLNNGILDDIETAFKIKLLKLNGYYTFEKELNTYFKDLNIDKLKEAIALIESNLNERGTQLYNELVTNLKMLYINLSTTVVENSIAMKDITTKWAIENNIVNHYEIAACIIDTKAKLIKLAEKIADNTIKETPSKETSPTITETSPGHDMERIHLDAEPINHLRREAFF